MKLIQILVFLPALSLLSVTATPVENADVPSSNDRPISLPLEDIPAGAAIFGLGEDLSPTARDGVDHFGGITKREDRHDCFGSSICPFLGGGACPAASGAYIDTAWYCGYTSRVSEHCTAIFTCGDYHGSCWAGWYLKQK